MPWLAQLASHMNATLIVDIFAGPGGLAEGFSSLVVNGRHPFRVALSIERDASAHETLRLRGFYRQFRGNPPQDYWDHLRGTVTRQELFARYPEQYQSASTECVQHELGATSDAETRAMVRRALRGHSGAWGLIGGPPCQAYSLVGRSRNRGVRGYVPEEDHRQTLYVEYLQILADHRPAFFIMENVKGLLSATLDSRRLFERIMGDLRDPADALRRENRRAPRTGPLYDVFSVSNAASELLGPTAADVIVRSEEYGIPQARHRVILLGVLNGSGSRDPGTLSRRGVRTAWSAIKDLPPVRSGLTDHPDEDGTWCEIVRSVARKPWMSDLDTDVREAILEASDRVRPPKAGRGAEYVRSLRAGCDALAGFVNHSTRAHIAADLERYFFAACYARARGKSPVLSDLPPSLLPLHANAAEAVRGGLFNDRFRVQLGGRPSTTITSHISKDGHYYIHPDPLQCRSLTVREAARLQTFPDDYLFCGPRTAQYHQVGNAVPPELSRQIAEVASRIV